MCDPIFWTGLSAAASSTGLATSGLFGAGGAFSLGTAVSTVGAGFGAIGTVMGAQQSAANSEYMAGIAGYNAQIADNNAIAAEYSAEYDREKFEDNYRRNVLSKIGPKFAVSGVVINQDTPGMVEDDAFTEGKREELAILYSGKTASAAHRAGAVGQRYAAINYMSNAGAQRTAGYINAAARLSTLGKGLLV